jgi:rare lipoprotein A (peptidoglycan hydrolase)
MLEFPVISYSLSSVSVFLRFVSLSIFCSFEAKLFTSKKVVSYTIKNRFGTHKYSVNESYYLSTLRTGQASFYEHGHMTACGNLFDKNQPVAAHPTAKIPCVAIIRRLDTGKSVYVVINDRGPFYPGRMCDLSLGCAKELNFVREGTTKVSIKILPLQSKLLALKWRSFRGKRLPDDLFRVIHNPLKLKRYLNNI